jgi:hypothetical protein
MAYLDVMHPMFTVMNTTFVEWCVALPACTAKVDAKSEPAITRAAYARFEASIAADPEKRDDPAAGVMRCVLHPARLAPESIRILRQRRANHLSTVADDVLANGLNLFAEVCAGVRAANWSQARSSVETYYRAMRVAHDLCGEYVSAYAAILDETLGQHRAAEITQRGLAGCDLLKNYWKKVVLKLDPEGLAAVLAEHLRGHFSGEKRGGAVAIVEDAEKIRLVMDPCGTGGALRRSAATSLSNYNRPTPDTWYRANEVPAYCAHCAKNEQMLTSILGYPAWVTEFDPDPAKPCGWTIYRDPADIPERYYTRIGRRKPSRAVCRLRQGIVRLMRCLA